MLRDSCLRLFSFIKLKRVLKLNYDSYRNIHFAVSFTPSTLVYKLSISQLAKGNFSKCGFCRHFKRTITYRSDVLRCSEDKNIEYAQTTINEFTGSMYRHPGIGHNILLIQPKVKFGPKSEKKPVLELKLSEAAALVNTLPNWTVIDKMIVPVAHLESSLIFGTGNLEKLRLIIGSNQRITAVFIGIDILTSRQNSELESILKVPVFDRYQVILQIFHDHAHTNEAKLQLALAEIPYLRIKLCSYSYTWDATNFSGIHHVGGDGETFMQTRRTILNEREIKLKKELEKIKNQREFLRRSEIRNSLPIVAVVGYTNCGKTTLIKSFTDDERLQPEDKLFATLDVTMYPGLLPSNQKVLYIDTVGFISDVPTELLQSFRSTLEEINLADLVIHIRDISHPDTENQKKTVLKTLEDLNLPPKLMDSIIEVRNKIDLLENPEDLEDTDAVPISATEGTGLSTLLEVVEEKLFENTGHSVLLIRTPNGGPEYRWLLKEAAIRDAMPDPQDANFLILEVVISTSNYSIFKHMFGDLTVTLESLSQ